VVNQKIALVVDDERDVVEVISDSLKSDLHYLVLPATNPETAVDFAKNYLFDLLILDLHMPKLDGIEVLNLVRKRQPDVKVMVITGLLDQYKERLEHLKVDQIIEKPLDFRQFQKDVTRLAGFTERESQKDSGQTPKAKILLVDDEREQCETLKEFILEDQPNQYEVELVDKPEDGITLCNEFEPDIVLFDIKMPHLRGDEMIQKIKSSGNHQPKLFIAVSAIGLPETINRLKKLGCLYVTKPFRIEELLKIVRDKCVELGLVTK